MNLRRWLFPWSRPGETVDEVRAELARLDANEPEIQRLGAELRAVQRRNHFSDMVRHAIERGAGGT